MICTEELDIYSNSRKTNTLNKFEEARYDGMQKSTVCVLVSHVYKLTVGAVYVGGAVLFCLEILFSEKAILDFDESHF